ncbi:MAG: hypothetical protein FJ388_20420, partial [Verrucomicrobia bacterium]|nr:hypothetical protein [Verrucomicrobiota bacterium]
MNKVLTQRNRRQSSRLAPRDASLQNDDLSRSERTTMLAEQLSRGCSIRRHGYAAILIAAALTLAVQTASAADFYVAPNGDDANPGTKAKPFATPARAVEAVRALAAGGLKTDVSVVFRAGTYELAAPLVFTPADSGTAQHSITYAAPPGETVVISGGRRLVNWRKAEGRKWTVELPDVKAGKWFFRQLVMNDRRAVRARWPKDDGALHIKTVGDGVKSFTFDRPLPRETLGGQNAELVVYENWSVSRAII